MSIANTSPIPSDTRIRVGKGLGPSWYPIIKEVLEGMAALILLVATSPLFVVMALLVKLTSHGPVIYSQRRVGIGGSVFTIYKIRSMTTGCEAKTGACWSQPGDPRVTPLGRFLRKTHLDELPQLWNVLRGDMSLIGPRPERPEFVVPLEQVLPDYRKRLRVKPGVTGLAQVQLPPDTDISSVAAKLAYDLYYVENMSARLDACILLGTVTHILGCSARVTRMVFGLPSADKVESIQIADLNAADPETPALAAA